MTVRQDNYRFELDVPRLKHTSRADGRKYTQDGYGVQCSRPLIRTGLQYADMRRRLPPGYRMSVLDEIKYLAYIERILRHDPKKRANIMHHAVFHDLVYGDVIEATHAFLRAADDAPDFRSRSVISGRNIHYRTDFGLDDKVIFQNILIPDGSGIGRDIVKWNAPLGIPEETRNCTNMQSMAVFYFDPSQKEVAIRLSGGIFCGYPFVIVDATHPRNSKALKNDGYRLFDQPFEELPLPKAV